MFIMHSIAYVYYAVCLRHAKFCPSVKKALRTDDQKRLCPNSNSNGRTKLNLSKLDFERMDKITFVELNFERTSCKYLRTILVSYCFYPLKLKFVLKKTKCKDWNSKFQKREQQFSKWMCDFCTFDLHKCVSFNYYSSFIFFIKDFSDRFRFFKIFHCFTFQNVETIKNVSISANFFNKYN